MSTKDARKQKLKAQLQELRAEMDRLEAKAGTAAADARIEYERQIETIEAKYDVARDRLESLADETGEAWDELASGVEHATKELGRSIRAAASKFQ